MKIKLLVSIVHGNTTLEAGKDYDAQIRIPARDDTPKWLVGPPGSERIPVMANQAVEVTEE